MAESMKAIGKKIICMEREYIPGLMEGSTKGTMKMIKSMDMGFTNGQTEEDMRGIGKMGNKRVLDTITLMGSQKKVFGRMEKDLSG